MSSHDERSQRLLKTILEMMSGTFNHISNEERLKNFYRESQLLGKIRIV